MRGVRTGVSGCYGVQLDPTCELMQAHDRESSHAL